MDSLLEQTSTGSDHDQLDQSGIAQRRLNDGRIFRVVKIFYDPRELERQLLEQGWHGRVRSSGHFFLYGSVTPIESAGEHAESLSAFRCWIGPAAGQRDSGGGTGCFNRHRYSGIISKSRVTCHTPAASRVTGLTTILPGSKPSSSGMPSFRRCAMTGSSSKRKSIIRDLYPAARTT